MTEDACTVSAGANKQLSKQGPAFTSAEEDIIVTRASIAAFENAICGVHQNDCIFKAHMFKLYKDMTAEASKTNKALLELEQSSHAIREEYIKKGVVNAFPLRLPESNLLQQIQAADFGRGYEVHGHY